MANKIPLDDRIYNYFALYVCILLDVNADSVFKTMGICPPPSKVKIVRKEKINHKKIAKVHYLFRHLCGESAIEIGERFNITNTYVYLLIQKGRKELIDEFNCKNHHDS